MSNAENLIWIDREMTGLVPETDDIIEIATIVTDKDLNVLAEGPEIAVHQPELARRWAPHVAAGFVKQGAHLALADIRESIRELRHYRAQFLHPAFSGDPASGNSSRT
jgi:oligoribonuclease